MPLVRYKYLEEKGIISNRMQLARAIERYGFPKPVALGENTLALPLEGGRKLAKIPPAPDAENRRIKAGRRYRGGRVKQHGLKCGEDRP